ncbi:hypothetical protein AB0H58_16760 [Nocardia neocaledoniensis]|uniref:hypothetical protein n=1 Tax=Nocardia neocaledoniensis TaxID=236511 RepID=UPI0033F62B5B
MANTFTSTHGVEFTDEDGTVWAKFTHDPELDRAEGTGSLRGYRFTTNDPQVAARLRRVRDYGITEVRST